jgi:hypothetical protein
MFPAHILEPRLFAARFIELLPEYLPGVDTGAFEATDRRRCWNKTLKAVLTVIAKEQGGLDVEAQSPTMTLLKDQSSQLWVRDGVPLFAMTTGWGDRSELESCLVWFEAFKCPQKLFIYSCSKWKETVLDQIKSAMLRYPYHLEGEQYIFMNLVGAENHFDLFVTDLDRSGRQLSRHDTLLRPVTGSPFRWTTKLSAAR